MATLSKTCYHQKQKGFSYEKRENIIFVTNTADTLASLRDSNSEAYEKYKDQYFLGKSQAYSIALDNIEHILSDYDEAESE
jgi:DNA-binding transcriptional regulator YhcF (GntR family)